MSDFSPQTSGPTGPRAGFGPRLGAFLLDGVLLYVVSLIVGVIFGQGHRSGGTASVHVHGLPFVIDLVIGIAYYVALEGGPRGQTLGKRAVGIRVYDLASGGPIGYGRAAVRYIGKLVSAVPCGLGDFWMLWDKEKQTWQDKFAGSIVVRTSDYPIA
jgi:uncharacterized RDD family membrane protein YckC